MCLEPRLHLFLVYRVYICLVVLILGSEVNRKSDSTSIQSRIPTLSACYTTFKFFRFVKLRFSFIFPY